MLVADDVEEDEGELAALSLLAPLVVEAGSFEVDFLARLTPLLLLLLVLPFLPPPVPPADSSVSYSHTTSSGFLPCTVAVFLQAPHPGFVASQRTFLDLHVRQA